MMMFPNDGFNRYYAVNPQGVAVWESDHAAEISERRAWDEFVTDCLVSRVAEIPYMETKIDDNIANLKKLGWRMVECRPSPVVRVS
jgi:hypothetical protein